MKLTKKQVYEFTRIYIGSILLETDEEGFLSLGLELEDTERIIEQIQLLGQTTLGNREQCSDPEEILKLI